MKPGCLILFLLLSTPLFSCHKKAGIQPVVHPQLVYHQDGDVKQLMYNDPNGVNIIVLGDAFVKDDLDTGGFYDQQVKKITDYMFTVEPYKEYKQHFNIYVVYAQSNNRRAAVGTPTDADRTKFSSYFDSQVTRLLMIANQDVTDTYIEKAVPLDHAHIVLMIVNDPIYGGSGGYYSTTSVDPNSKYIAIHEIGHSFGGLTDEYEDDQLAAFTTRAGALAYPNTDTTKDPLKIKWAHFLDKNAYRPVVNIFAGGYYFANGVYRPERGSVMLAYNYLNYNAPSREAIVKRMDSIMHVPFDFNDFLKIDSLDAQSIVIAQFGLQPIRHDFIGGMARMHWLRKIKLQQPHK